MTPKTSQMQSYFKTIFAIITFTTPWLTSSSNEPHCNGIMYADISKQSNTNNIQFHPTDICVVHYDDNTDTQISTMFQCNEDASDISLNTWPNTDCSGSTIDNNYNDIMNSNYSVFCTGIPCDYGIIRYYPVSNCNDNIEEINDKYYDKVVVINDSFADTIYTKCNEITDGICTEQMYKSKVIWCIDSETEIFEESKLESDKSPSVKLLVLVSVSVIAFMASLCFIFYFIHRNYSGRLNRKIARMNKARMQSKTPDEIENYERETIDIETSMEIN